VPRILARALREAGVPEAAIAQIPDEQEAIDAALHMGRAGDLVLIFADALVRSWKQVIKFRPDGAAPARAAEAVAATAPPPPTGEAAADAAVELDGLVRDERGVRLGREEAD
jgi:cyanophycin synthetase